jgi:predicted AAA+ superfamily ATPase
MRPLSLFESGHSTAAVSLARLFDGADPGRAVDPAWTATTAREWIAQRIVTGGWPANITLTSDEAAVRHADYLKVVCEHDVPGLAGARRDPATARRVVASVARNVASPATITTLAAGAVHGSAEDPDPDVATSRDAVREHMQALERLLILEDQPGWSPRLRSSRLSNTTPKRHFADPCLAAAALGAGWRSLADDVLALGFLFESLVVRDLRVYAEPVGGELAYYRDKDKLEIDAIIHLPDGRWGAIEVKLGSDKGVLDRAAQRLRSLDSRIDSRKCAFLTVVTNGPVAYRRPDGVNIIPLAMLGP